MIDITTLSLPVKVLSESTTHAVESDRVDAAVGESKAETQNTKVMPKGIIVLFRSRMNIKPQHENMLWKKANSKHNNESHYHLCHLFTGLYLLHLKYSGH